MIFEIVERLEKGTRCGSGSWLSMSALGLLDEDASLGRLLGADWDSESEPDDAGFFDVVEDGVLERGGTDPALGFFEFSFSSTTSNRTSRNRIPFTKNGRSCSASHFGSFLSSSSTSCVKSELSTCETRILKKVKTYFRLFPCNAISHLFFFKKSTRVPFGGAGAFPR